MTTATLQQTPFHDFHIQHGAKLVDYTGWEMPLLYGSIIEEHKQVRESGGVFDVSHMGRLRFKGRDAALFLDTVCTRAIASMKEGQVRYTLVCNASGGCRDDVLIYCMDSAEYLMVCNAANRQKLVEHFEATKGEMVFSMKDETLKTAMLAVQGPKVMEMISDFSQSIPDLKRYRFIEKSILMVAKIQVSRTGYTGEDGVEIILPAKLAGPAMNMLGLKGDLEETPIRPCGLGARDSLRMEAGMPLYGHEIDEETDPLTVGLGFAVKLDKETPFIGQEALQAIDAAGPQRRLVGLFLEGRRAARQGMPVLLGENVIGSVTSGCLSPTLDRSIAMAIIDADHSDISTTLAVDLGRQRAEAAVTALPFLKKP